MRSAVLFLAVAVSGCSFLDQLDFGGSGLASNKIYLRPGEIADVALRENHRYACAGQPLLCVQYGITFECRCP